MQAEPPEDQETSLTKGKKKRKNRSESGSFSPEQGLLKPVVAHPRGQSNLEVALALAERVLTRSETVVKETKARHRVPQGRGRDERGDMDKPP